LDFNCSFLFIHNYTTHSYNLSPYIPMPEGRGITAMDGKNYTASRRALLLAIVLGPA